VLKVRSEPPLSARQKAFPFQVEAVEAVKDLPFAAVFHEQGLGKSKIAVDLALTWLAQRALDSVLIVTKKGLIENWRQEIRAHSFLIPKILGQDRKANYYSFNSPARFYLVHYEACLAEKSRLILFQKARRLGVICDEAQKMKNPESRIARAMFALAPGFLRRVIMTGTPIANRPYDIWALIYFLDQGKSLGASFAEFKSQLDLTVRLASDADKEKEFRNALAQLAEKLRPFTVRETKATAGITLPGKQVHSMMTAFEPRQQQIYSAFRDELKATIVRDGRIILDDAEDVLKRLLRLVQVASNPRLVDASYGEVPGKLGPLLQLVRDAVAADTKVIVWTSFTENVDWLRERLSHYSAAKVHGKMNITDRNAAIQRFKTDSECRVLVATPGAAKEGLTLTVATHAIFYDRSFSLDDYLQAQDRIHRISQNRECHIYNLLMQNSVDEWVDALLGSKHVAAQLGQGDITVDAYRRTMSYDFAELLRSTLA
jgi:SNF2 family DNA or RNA helicase